MAISRRLSKKSPNPSGGEATKVAQTLGAGQPVNHGGKALQLWLAQWEFIKDSSEPNEFIAFLNEGPPADLVRLAKVAWERLEWRRISTHGTVPHYEKFLLVFPQGEHASEAQLKLKASRVEATDWAKVTASGKIKEVKQFVEKYPLGQNNEAARQLLFELRRKEILRDQRHANYFLVTWFLVAIIGAKMISQNPSNFAYANRFFGIMSSIFFIFSFGSIILLPRGKDESFVGKVFTSFFGADYRCCWEFYCLGSYLRSFSLGFSLRHML